MTESARPLVDDEALAQLAEDVGPDLLPSMVEAFVGEMRQRVEALARAVAAEDGRAVGEAAHALKGGAGTFGAPALQDAAYLLEQAGKHGELARVAEQWPVVQALAGQTDAALSERFGL